MKRERKVENIKEKNDAIHTLTASSVSTGCCWSVIFLIQHQSFKYIQWAPLLSPSILFWMILQQHWSFISSNLLNSFSPQDLCLEHFLWLVLFIFIKVKYYLFWDIFWQPSVNLLLALTSSCSIACRALITVYNWSLFVHLLV